MREIKDLLVETGESNTFDAVTKNAKPDTGLAIFAGNSGAMIAGYEGKIVKIDYAETEGIRTPNLTQDQVVNFTKADGSTESFTLQYAIKRDKDGNEVIGADGKPVFNKPMAPTIFFEDGRKMTLGLLLQGGAKTVITYKDGTKVNAVNLKLGAAKMLVGRSFLCTNYFTDQANLVQRNDANGNIASARPRNCYEFVETTPDAAA